MRKRMRLDELVLERGLAKSRSEARGIIMAGLVTVDGKLEDKAGTSVLTDAMVEVKPRARYVSRAGQKLAGALKSLRVSVPGRSALDIGASTGGFVDCLLQEGAQRVIALDVGRGQLDSRLRKDERVHVIEGVNARFLEAEQLPYAADLLTMDVSFISVQKVLPAVSDCMAESMEGIVLVKPQFEAGPRQVGRKGVVRDPAIHRQVLVDTLRFASEKLGLQVLGLCSSVLPGVSGNVEFFIHVARCRDDGLRIGRLEERVEQCLQDLGRSTGEPMHD